MTRIAKKFLPPAARCVAGGLLVAAMFTPVLPRMSHRLGDRMLIEAQSVVQSPDRVREGRSGMAHVEASPPTGWWVFSTFDRVIRAAGLWR